MSYADISPAAVLRLIQAGHRTLADLVPEFEVLPTSRYLADAIGTLIASGEIHLTADGYVPHDLLEGLEDQ
ncbi:hypothetical protein [Paractinoplanes toevensis]|uniref:Uncharacterized protein n=1 Tax=Paractinoplanes toevensis TaxID=571911 RepID=A0A919VYB1_9ACTN|nr:hypothetical protein [Actinoplanes toevensis]GIM88802.1 hypothetical protein Ato02nite_005950 [Actinoplanes toevensis]